MCLRGDVLRGDLRWRACWPGGKDQVEGSLDRFPQFVLRVAAVATVLAPPVMIPVSVADLAQMSQRRVQVVPELKPLIDRIRDHPVQRAEIPRLKRRERLLVGPEIDRPDAHRAAEVVIPHRVQVRPPEIQEAALAEPQLVREPVGAFGSGLQRDFLRRQVDRHRDLNVVKRVGPVQHLAEGIHGLQERLRVNQNNFTRSHVSARIRSSDSAPMPHGCIGAIRAAVDNSHPPSGNA